jgi:3-phosphoglycerate kinase
MLRTLRSFDLKNKKILIRVDFNTPMTEQVITDNFRIKSSLPTIKTCLESGAALTLMSHIGRPNGIVKKSLSLMPIGEELARLLQMPIKFSDNCVSQDSLDVSLGLKPGEIHLLENLRFHKSEELNDPVFASKLAKHGQIFINDAFGTAHRNHASNVGILPYFKHYGIGLLMDKEINFLDSFMRKPKEPLVLILGGAKINSKIGLIDKFISKATHILIGGGMAFTFLKARGKEVGGSMIEDSMISVAKKLLKMASEHNVQIHLPEDVLCAKNISDVKADGTFNVNEIPSNLMGLDIGPKTIDKFKRILKSASTVMWNGPLGLFENITFEEGTKDIATYLSELYEQNVKIIIGGGDTASAVSKFNLIKSMTHVSTGGGSSLELLSGNSLPAINEQEI